MLGKKLEELYNLNDYEEIKSLLEDTDKNTIIETFSKLNKEFLSKLYTKISPELAAETFINLSKDLQSYLVNTLSYVEFKLIANELLYNDAENILDKDVFNEILLKAKAEIRNEKLIDIIDKLENRQFSSLKPLLSELEPIDIAEIFQECEQNKIAVLFRLLPKDLASEVFVEMDTESQQILIKSFTDKELAYIVNDIFVDDTVDIIEEMPSNVVNRILALSNPETREQINKLLGYPKDTAGSVMTTEYVTLKEKMTVYEALKKIRSQAINKETIYTCYVIDDKKHLIGIVSAKDLILHEPTDIIASFVDRNVITATTKTDREEVSNLLTKYDMLAIPIVDTDNRMSGIVTIDDAVDVIQEETTEDINKMAAIMSTSSKPYLQTNVFKLYISRMPWLLILLISATFTGLIINAYESLLSALLFACVPMLMGAGGNAGSQSSVTIIRALSLNEVEFRDIFRIIWKEIRVAILVALTLSICCFGKLQLIDNLVFGNDYTIIISLVVSLALFVTILLSKIIGCCLPLIAKKIKLDPAVVASPFITTIIDVLSLIIYCQIAGMLL
ncbi:MAG: magnesium transporter [Clostridia bacterium]|nr:magnesium transporter [Clostridia bacterium]